MITYLLGAGASVDCIPVVKYFRDAVREMLEYIVKYFSDSKTFINEFLLRFNTRNDLTNERFDLILCNVIGRLTYKQLIGNE